MQYALNKLCINKINRHDIFLISLNFVIDKPEMKFK